MACFSEIAEMIGNGLLLDRLCDKGSQLLRNRSAGEIASLVAFSESTGSDHLSPEVLLPCSGYGTVIEVPRGLVRPANSGAHSDDDVVVRNDLPACVKCLTCGVLSKQVRVMGKALRNRHDSFPRPRRLKSEASQR